MRPSKLPDCHNECLTTIISTRQFSLITFTKESLKGLENGQYVNDDIVLFYQQYDLHKFWAQCHSDYNISRVLYQNLMKNNPDRTKEIYIFSLYFFSRYERRGQAENPISDMEHYLAGAKFVFCDLFAKDYILIPVLIPVLKQ